MRHAELRAVVHNVADSLANGIGLLIGTYDMDVYGEAAASRDGAITVDFLGGYVVEGQPSSSLVKAVELYRTAFARLCAEAGGSIEACKEARARFWADAAGRGFTVTVTDAAGRRTETEYAGVPAPACEGRGRTGQGAAEAGYRLAVPAASGHTAATKCSPARQAARWRTRPAACADGSIPGRQQLRKEA